jgi:DNA-binding transcriptional ArsR family regulator
MPQRPPDIFTAIADPTRRALLDRLSRGEQPVQALADGFEMSFAAVSQHLQLLHAVGVVERRAEGRQRYYRLNPKPLQQVRDWSATLTAYWDESLDRLEQFLDDRYGKGEG